MRTFFLTIFAAITCALLVAFPTRGEANVENFEYESWSTQVDLRVTANGRSVAQVTETLVAVFPDTDQNKGIVRGLPLNFHGADAAPRNISVTDADGHEAAFFTEDEDDFRVILTGTDAYVHGRQTYVISYEIPDPIFVPNDADVDEFYWDMVSVDRAQPIRAFSAHLTLDDSLERAQVGQAVGYTGSAGSTTPAEVISTGAVHTYGPVSLGPNEVVTFALAFTPDTVVQPNARIPNAVTDTLPLVVSAAGFVVSLGATAAIVRMRRRRRSTGKAIIARYQVPLTLPPLLAAAVRHPEPLDGFTAQMLHLAVNGRIRIEERTKKDGSLYKRPRPVLRNLAAGENNGLAHDPLDTEVIRSIFTGKHPEVFRVPRSSSSFAATVASLSSRAKEASFERGYFTRERSRTAIFLAACGAAFVIITAALIIAAMITGFMKDLTFVGVLMSAISLPFIVTGFMRHRVHTPMGAEAYELLGGVKLFITFAEADRIRILQSPSGAERHSVDGVQVLHLYEQLLPYAVMFRLEKEWSTVLQTQYESQSLAGVAWYPHLYTRGLSNLSDTVSHFSGSVRTAASYTSSSASGSTGGGFAGGGGGGGFSGGR